VSRRELRGAELEQEVVKHLVKVGIPLDAIELESVVSDASRADILVRSPDGQVLMAFEVKDRMPVGETRDAALERLARVFVPRRVWCYVVFLDSTEDLQFMLLGLRKDGSLTLTRAGALPDYAALSRRAYFDRLEQTRKKKERAINWLLVVGLVIASACAALVVLRKLGIIKVDAIDWASSRWALRRSCCRLRSA
jgi:hypothetical protein